MRPHAHAVSRTRKLVLFLAATGSLVAGFALVWVFAPRAFHPLSTLELVVILGLLVLPGATLWAVLTDRRLSGHSSDAAPPSPPSVPTAGSLHAPMHLPRVQTHPASSRQTRIGQQAHEHA